MNDMPPKHAAVPAAPEKRRDHLWVLVIIAGCAGLDICSAWVTIGSMSRFQVLFGTVPTDWTLAVIAEAYWGYALFCWLAGASGPRSRRFAKWSAALVFLLSLTGQAAAHLIRPGAPPNEALVIFASCLPAIVLAAIAFLVHLRQADREETAEAVRREAEAERTAEEERMAGDERTALRAGLATERQAHAAELRCLQEELAAERAGRTEAQEEAALRARFEMERNDAVAALEARETELQAAETALAQASERAESAEAKAERLTRKLGANSGAGRNRNAARKDSAQGRTTVPNDVDARAQALSILIDEPGITGKELGERCGRGERWGQLRKSELAGHVADGTGAGSEGGVA
jgi:hypothetical protein